MFTIAVLISVEASEVEQCKTVARKVSRAITQATQRAPYRVTHEMTAQRVDDSPIVKPDQVSMVQHA